MFEIISFDICALAVLIVILCANGSKKSSSDEASKKLLYLVIVTIIVGTLDIVANVNNGNGSRVAINYYCSGLYHILRNVTFYLYVSYIVSTVGIVHKVKNLYIEILKFVPLVAVICIAVTTPFNHVFYFYDDTSRYMRGKGFLAIYIFTSIYAFFAIYYIWRNVYIIGKRKALSLASCAIFSFAASVVQYMKPYVVVDIFGFALSILFITLFVDNPGDKIDRTSFLMNRQAYTNELRTIFFTNRPVDIVHINIANHKTLEEMLGYSNYVSLIKTISDKAVEVNIKLKKSAELFYLRDGRFRAILNGNDLDRTNAFAKDMLKLFNSYINVNGADVVLESSVCISRCPEDFNVLDNLLDFGAVASRFEEAGTIVYSKEIMKIDGYDVLSNLNRTIEKGIIDGKFELYYQPIYNIETNDYKEVETILRLHETDKKIIEPDTFYPIAEQSGAITELGRFAMEETCKFIDSDEFKNTGIEKLSIRLSAVNCLQKDIVDRIDELIGKYNISPKMIRFNITESLATDNQKIFASNITKLSEEGYTFAIDKYGSGYSNITTISLLPIEVVKFDRSFAGGEEYEKIRIVFENSAEMMKMLGKKVIIEEVDDWGLVEKFKLLGCDFMQGDAIAKVMTKQELLDFYSNLNA
ncbi:MAG: EAL domain-containing protein [Lachnospiraceae bacterium]|nr:EAL domain-containing protein [Lachnospiraceae bacterium]